MSQIVTCQTKRRDSNLELFRIILMLMIIMHHYVVNSGLFPLLLDSRGSVLGSVFGIFVICSLTDHLRIRFKKSHFLVNFISTLNDGMNGLPQKIKKEC